MIEVVLAVATLAAWYGFLRLLQKGRAVTRPQRLFVNITANVQGLVEAFAKVGVAAQEAAVAMRGLSAAWANEAARVERVLRGS